jgi:pilus assembly protein Flp/PilA
MRFSSVTAAVSLVARLVSGRYLYWLGLCTSFGVYAVSVYVRCHSFISGGYAKFLPVASERGVTAIEYGLVASLIALAIIVAVKLVGTNLTGLFDYIGGKIVTP